MASGARSRVGVASHVKHGSCTITARARHPAQLTMVPIQLGTYHPG